MNTELTKENLKNIYGTVSPFEFKDKLLKLASLNNNTILDAGRGMAWLDTGTHKGLLEASNYVEAVQTRQGLYIACLEEIAYRKGYIDKDKLLKLAKPLMKTEYGQYLVKIANENQNNEYLNETDVVAEGMI